MQLLRHCVFIINGLNGQRVSIKRRLDIRMHLLAASTELGYEQSSIGHGTSSTEPSFTVTIRASGGNYEAFRVDFSVAAAGATSMWS